MSRRYFCKEMIMNVTLGRISLLCLLTITLFAAIPVLNAQSNFKFGTFDFPGATSTAPTGPRASIMPEEMFDVPDALGTGARGINDQGDIVGRYTDAQGVFHGFLRRDGKFETIDHPSGVATQLFGIISTGDIVGHYRRPNDGTVNGGTTHAFLLSGETGTFTAIDVPGTNNTLAIKMTPSGEVVGCHHVTTRPDGDGFVPDSMQGYVYPKYSLLEVPGSMHNGITPDGETIVGLVFEEMPNNRGYVYVRADDAYTEFDFPGAISTDAWDINAHGEIVGLYSTVDERGTRRDHGFLLKKDGDFVSIDVPDALHTRAFGINSEGTIVGEYVDSSGTHAFVATRDEEQ